MWHCCYHNASLSALRLGAKPLTSQVIGVKARLNLSLNKRLENAIQQQKEVAISVGERLIAR
eukprot:418039-Amphidinium_carterae.1